MLASPVLHRRAFRHSAHHRQQGGNPHSQLADADHAVDHADHRHVSGRATVSAIGYAWRSCSMRCRFCLLRACISRAARSQKRRLSRRAPRPDGSDGGAALERVPRRPALHALVAAGVRQSRCCRVGWATGGGAAQILFSLFGEQVFNRGAARHRHHLGLRRHRPAGGRRVRELARPPALFRGVQAVVVRLITSSTAPPTCSSASMTRFELALLFIFLSRAVVAVSSVLNYLVAAALRGRPVSRPRVRHHGDPDLDHDDGLHDGRGHRIRPITVRAPSGRSPDCSAPPPRSSGAGRTGPAGCRGPPQAGVEPKEVEVHGDPVV